MFSTIGYSAKARIIIIMVKNTAARPKICDKQRKMTGELCVSHTEIEKRCHPGEYKKRHTIKPHYNEHLKG